MGLNVRQEAIRTIANSKHVLNVDRFEIDPVQDMLGRGDRLDRILASGQTHRGSPV